MATGRQHVWRWLVAGLAVAVVGLGVGLGLALTGGTNSSLSSSETAQLASVQSGCHAWASANPTPAGSGQWCDEMEQWMSQEMEQHGFGPQMMWGDPSSLRSTCERWMSESPPSGAPANGQDWCDSMVSWMTDHVQQWSGEPNWNQWMTGNGPMMGGPGS